MRAWDTSVCNKKSSDQAHIKVLIHFKRYENDFEIPNMAAKKKQTDKETKLKLVQWVAYDIKMECQKAQRQFACNSGPHMVRSE